MLGGVRTRIASGVAIGIQDSLDQLAAHPASEHIHSGVRRPRRRFE